MSTTATPGLAARTRAASSRPSRPGIVTSVTSTSKCFPHFNTSSRGFPVFGFNDLVALFLKGQSGDLPNGVLIFHKQDGHAALAFRSSETGAGVRIMSEALPLHHGSMTRKVVPAPSADSTSIRPPACCTMPKTVARPRPVPLSGPFVVKNGSKSRAFTSSVMPVPVSVIVSRANCGMALIGVVIDRRADGQRASGGHRIASVHREVHHHLFQMAAVGSHRHRRGREFRFNHDATTEYSAEQPGEGRYDFVQVQHLHASRLAATEHQKLANERCRAIGG